MQKSNLSALLVTAAMALTAAGQPATGEANPKKAQTVKSHSGYQPGGRGAADKPPKRTLAKARNKKDQGTLKQNDSGSNHLALPTSSATGFSHGFLSLAGISPSDDPTVHLAAEMSYIVSEIGRATVSMFGEMRKSGALETLPLRRSQRSNAPTRTAVPAPSVRRHVN